MKLHPPFLIGSRLLPCLTVGGATLSLERDDYASAYRSPDGRDVYRWTIDLPGGSGHSDNDLRSGCQGGSLQSMFGTLLGFLSAAGESLRYCEGQGREPDEDDNASLFPPAVTQWARENADELSMLACEIEETDTALIEE